MKLLIYTICLMLGFSFSLRAANSTFLDYQNYNHGYCPECSCYPCRCDGGCADEESAPPCNTCPGQQPACNTCPGQAPAPCNTCPQPNPCDPAPVCATQCGISLWCIGATLAGIAAAGAILIGINNGHTAH